MMKPTVKSLGAVLVTILLFFVLLAAYLNLNLTHINYGYEQQRLRTERDALSEEIDQLQARRAGLLSLQRVESVVTERLQYQYPQGDQFIKVFADR